MSLPAVLVLALLGTSNRLILNIFFSMFLLILKQLTILLGMGYKDTKAQLMSVPPYAVAAAMTVFIG